MDDLVLINRIQKLLKENYNQIANVMVGGGVDSMEKYKYIIGQINALESVRQEIITLLTDKEENDRSGTIVDLKRGPKA